MVIIPKKGIFGRRGGTVALWLALIDSNRRYPGINECHDFSATIVFSYDSLSQSLSVVCGKSVFYGQTEIKHEIYLVLVK